VHAGFTIIESMLFLAISALVFVVGFAGIGARLEAVRYTDSVRNLESDVETIFRNADDGLNLRLAEADCTTSGQAPDIDPTGGTTRGQDEQCAVAGVDISFDTATSGNFTADSMAVVTGQNNGGFNFFSPEQVNDKDFDISPFLANAAAIPGTNAEYRLQWGLQYIGYVTGGSVSGDVVTVRYIRSPISPQTFIYSYVGNATPSQLNAPLQVCFADQSDRTATLTFQPNATVDVTYQGDECSP